ncbi:MAG: aa3-type cytochrome c oxidase subunit IV [Alphaproteobacteria bacterium]|nr:aa3-type cytochrome c oxidase subunit IV [Alphaproteobacteria bacterium]
MSIDTTGGHQAMDYPQHVSTYKTFLRLTTATIIGCVILLAGMLYFLV